MAKGYKSVEACQMVQGRVVGVTDDGSPRVSVLDRGDVYLTGQDRRFATQFDQALAELQAKVAEGYIAFADCFEVTVCVLSRCGY